MRHSSRIDMYRKEEKNWSGGRRETVLVFYLAFVRRVTSELTSTTECSFPCQCPASDTATQLSFYILYTCPGRVARVFTVVHLLTNLWRRQVLERFLVL